MNYPFKTMIAEVKREIAMRERVFPRFVQAKKMTELQASERIAIMADVLEVLQNLDSQVNADEHALSLARDGAL